MTDVQPTRRRRKKVESPPEVQRVQLETDTDGIESLTLHAGEQLYAPKQFHSFRVGGHDIKVVPRDGESVADMVKRARAVLDEIVEAEFAYELENFRRRVKETRGEVSFSGMKKG